jgi:hypothetical protein
MLAFTQVVTSLFFISYRVAAPRRLYYRRKSFGGAFLIRIHLWLPVSDTVSIHLADGFTETISAYTISHGVNALFLYLKKTSNIKEMHFCL